MRRKVSLLDRVLDQLEKLPDDSLTSYAIYCQHYDIIDITFLFFFTGFRVEAVVRKVTGGLSMLKQAFVPILTGPTASMGHYQPDPHATRLPEGRLHHLAVPD